MNNELHFMGTLLLEHGLDLSLKKKISSPLYDFPVIWGRGPWLLPVYEGLACATRRQRTTLMHKVAH